MTECSMFPLNELGKIFYALERTGYPVIQRAHFDLQGGCIDIELLRRAYLLEIIRHPIFNAVVHTENTLTAWNAHWKIRDEAPDTFQYCSFHDFTDMPSDAAERKVLELLLDPCLQYSSSRDPAFFMKLCRLPGKTYKLIAFFNHAAADAGGAFLFLRNLFLRYNSLAGPQEEKGAPCCFIDPVMQTPLLPETRRARAVILLKSMTVLAQHVMHRRGTASKMIYNETAWYPGIHAVLRHICPERVQRYLASARYFGTTLTGFFVAAKILAFARWKKQRRESCRTVSVQIHKSLRTTGEALRQIQNKFSVFFVVTRDKDIEPPERLISVVKKQCARAQKNAVAENLIGILWLLRFASALWLLPFWVKLFFSKSKFGDSFQVSNVGRIFCDESGKTMLTRLGDSEITACYCTSLPVPSMGNFTSLTTFQDSLFLSFNYCTRAIDRADAEKFVAMFEQALEDLADAARV